jgi:hypothetical protein
VVWLALAGGFYGQAFEQQQCACGHGEGDCQTMRDGSGHELTVWRLKISGKSEAVQLKVVIRPPGLLAEISGKCDIRQTFIVF